MAELAHHIGDDILPELRAPAARGKMLLHEKGEAPSARCTWGALRMIRAMGSALALAIHDDVIASAAVLHAASRVPGTCTDAPCLISALPGSYFRTAKAEQVLTE
jgi:hypothetical protein